MLTRKKISETKIRQEGEFLPVLLSSLISFLIGKEVMTAGKGIMRVGGAYFNMDHMGRSFSFHSIL